MTTKLTVNKLDAARRQLETAIRLYFDEADPVSVHTLTAAAYRLILDVNTNRGGNPLFVQEQFLELFKPECVSEVRRKLNEAANFFKHADRDPTDAISFDSGQSEVLLLEACRKYHELTRETNPIFSVFLAWYMIRYPEMFILPPEREALRPLWEQELGQDDKQSFLRKMLPVASRRCVSRRTAN